MYLEDGDYPGTTKQLIHKIRGQTQMMSQDNFYFLLCEAMGTCGLSLASSPNLNVNTFFSEYLFLLSLYLRIDLRTLGGFIAVITCLCSQNVSYMPVSLKILIQAFFYQYIPGAWDLFVIPLFPDFFLIRGHASIMSTWRIFVGAWFSPLVRAQPYSRVSSDPLFHWG